MCKNLLLSFLLYLQQRHFISNRKRAFLLFCFIRASFNLFPIFCPTFTWLFIGILFGFWFWNQRCFPRCFWPRILASDSLQIYTLGLDQSRGLLPPRVGDGGRGDGVPLQEWLPLHILVDLVDRLEQLRVDLLAGRGREVGGGEAASAGVLQAGEISHHVEVDCVLVVRQVRKVVGAVEAAVGGVAGGARSPAVTGAAVAAISGSAVLSTSSSTLIFEPC